MWMASFETPLILKVSHTYKKLLMCAFGSSSESPSNCTSILHHLYQIGIVLEYVSIYYQSSDARLRPMMDGRANPPSFSLLLEVVQWEQFVELVVEHHVCPSLSYPPEWSRCLLSRILGRGGYSEHMFDLWVVWNEFTLLVRCIN